MLNNHARYKYETPYKGPFVIKQYWTNDKVALQYGPTKIRHNILSDRNIEDINPEKYV